MNIVFITGAGISAPSGIRTYRGEGGLWTENPELENKLNFHNLHRKDIKSLITQYSKESREMMKDAQPNAAHIAIAQLEVKHNVTVITQNVDGLHTKAGSTNVIEMHGNIWRDKTDPDGFERPDVVMFGENLNGEDWDRAELAVGLADYVYIVGTSAVVWPVANLFEIASWHYSKDRIKGLYAFNLEPLSNTEYYMRDYKVTLGDCSVTLPIALSSYR